MKTFKILTFLTLTVLISICLAVIMINNNFIFVKEINLKNKKASTNLHGLKIIHLSDTHFKNYETSELKSLVNQVNLSEPDIIVFTGDLFNKINQSQKITLTTYLSKFNAKAAKLAVLGEKDNTQSEAILNEAKFIVLKNKLQPVYVNNTKPLYFYGVKSNSKINADDFKIINSKKDLLFLLVHNPDHLNKFLNFKPDYIFAGHTHNQEVNIPFMTLKTEVETNYPLRYEQVKYSKLYITNGLGTSKNKFRFNSNREINLYRLLKKN